MVLLSGGIDSATALYLTRRRSSVLAITFEYHGIARREIEAARLIASRAGVEEHRLVRVPDLREAADISGSRFRGLPPTYIPMRNSVFYSFAASYAEETGASELVGGHNRDDARVFRDVSTPFFDALQAAFRAGSPILRRGHLKISRPLARLKKAEVVERAASLGVPLELTWSCHLDGSEHCWECQGCLSRREAFMRAGVPDPLFGPRRAKIT